MAEYLKIKPGVKFLVDDRLQRLIQRYGRERVIKVLDDLFEYGAVKGIKDEHEDAIVLDETDIDVLESELRQYVRVRVKEDVYLVEECRELTVVPASDLEQYVHLYCRAGTVGDYDMDEGVLITDEGQEYYIPFEYVEPLEDEEV